MPLLVAAILLAIDTRDELRAQTFNSGSDGSFGPMNITNNTTLDLPANGIFNCTTITIAGGATLSFNKNPLNTPVYLLATGDVTVNGAIAVNGTDYSGGSPGIGGPGGFDGGFGGFGVGANTRGGDGQGPGGGPSPYGGAFAAAVPGNGKIYGNSLLSPLIGGSGGGGLDGNPGIGGGGGGGGILIASNTRILVSGYVNARGGSSYFGSGSGGAIRLVSPVVNGSGSLDSRPGYTPNATSGSVGRIRIDCLDAYAFRSLTMNGVATRGSQMFVFPATNPRLDILQAAGQTIPEGTASGVTITLPAGSDTNRTVTVQARDFTNSVPIRVAVVSENRPSTTYDAVITMTNNPSQITVNVVIPDGTISRISSWTR